MKALVTGAAGFIGSHLCEALVAAGHEVVGVDCFTPYYDPSAKRANLADLVGRPGFELREADLRTADVDALLEGVDTVFHQAGQPGVRLSWDRDFAVYVEHNVLATQRLLEGMRRVPVRRLVYASSSSVYGNAERYPTLETDLPRPYSPYGVTKLAAEHLCFAYAANWGHSVVALRYFTVYGPRQRPDMGIRRFVDAALDGTPVTVHGDGEQVRDFTYVDDVVAANLAAAAVEEPPAGAVNVAGGGSVSVNELLATIEELTGRRIDRRHDAAQPGDVRRTGGSIEAARRTLGWAPSVGVREGLARQIAWSRATRAVRG